MRANIIIGIDIGGTFTDAVAMGPGFFKTVKTASRPSHPGRAVLEALDALNLESFPQKLLHGTTLVTNMILEGKGAETGFITSRGFRDILHIGRHNRPLNYAIRQKIPRQHDPPVPRKWRLTVPERVSFKGEVMTPLDENAVREAALRLIKTGVKAIAVGFLHSYRHPVHERRAVELIQESAPDIFVCASSDTSPRFREYERFLTAAWNARVAPAAASYLDNLAEGLSNRRPSLTLTMMSSNGGLELIFAAESERGTGIRRNPIRLALSGPAAAGSAVVRVAQRLELKNCLGLDMGGTSSDIVVVREGELREAPQEEWGIGGYPLQSPMLDLHSVGAGGGSFVERDPYGLLRVGPESAGSRPGPACYGGGGEKPTLTDAGVVTGRLPESVLLGGRIPLCGDLAWKAFQNAFGKSKVEIVKTALDSLSLAEAQIAFAIRERTVARGIDPREMALVAAGGAGPMLACGVAGALQLREVIIPPHPGLLAAWGLLCAPDRRENEGAVLERLDELSMESVEALFQKVEGGITPFSEADSPVMLKGALRYLGQGYEVEVPLEWKDTPESISERFHEKHEWEYGFAARGAPVEWVSLRATVEKAPPQWDFQLEEGVSSREILQTTVWEYISSGSIPLEGKAGLLERGGMKTENPLPGPAIITEPDATTYVPTGWRACLSREGYLRIRRG